MFEGLLGGVVSGVANLFGGDANARNARQIAEQNIWNQQQFAKNAIQWKVEDAKQAGIHPLFALGASTQGFNNVVGDTSLGDSIGRAGQDIGRAISASGDADSRKLLLRSAELDIEGKGLDNDIKRAELASAMRKLSQPGNPPSMPDYSGINADEAQRTLGPGPGPLTIRDPLFGDVDMPAGPRSKELQDELGEGADVLIGTRYVNEWLRKYTGRPLVTPRDIKNFQRYIRPFLSGRR